MFSGALALIALEAVIRTDASAGRIGSLLTGLATITRRVMSPAVPAIPDLAGYDSKAINKSAG